MKKISLFSLIVLMSLMISSFIVIAQSTTIEILDNKGIVLLFSMQDCPDMRDCAQKENPDYVIKSQSVEIKPGKYLLVSDYEKQEVEIKLEEHKKVELTIKTDLRQNEITGAATSPILDGTSIGIGIIILLGVAIIVAQVVSYQTRKNRQNRFELYLQANKKRKNRK